MPWRCNIAILAHIDAGKTTVTEHLLHLGGQIRRPGSVDAGTTVTDWMVEEQERGITISSAATTLRWHDAEITLVDTPGHVDFTIEVERMMRVIDGVVLVISGPDGVQAQTEAVWAQRAKAQVPAMAFINKLDLEGVDLDAVLSQITTRLDVLPVPLQTARLVDGAWRLWEVVPGETEPLVQVWRSGTKGPHTILEVTEEPPDELDEVARLEARERLVDAIASHDDSFAEMILTDRALTPDDYVRALSKAVRSCRVLPVLFGSARQGLGVERLADALVMLLPGSTEKAKETFAFLGRDAERTSDGHNSEDESCVYVFKTEPRRLGTRLAYVRVFSGAISEGATLVRTPDGTSFTPSAIGRVMGRDVDPLGRLEAGQIGVLSFAPDVSPPHTGDTLGTRLLSFTLERLQAPEPVLEVPVEASDPESHQRVLHALQVLCEDDPSLRLGVERDTGRLLLAGMGELHLEVALERVEREQALLVKHGRAQVRRRFALAGPGEGHASVQHPAGRARVAISVRVRPHSTLELIAPDGERPDWRSAIVSGLEAAAGLDGMGSYPLLQGFIEVIAIETGGSDIVPVMLRDAAEWAALRAIEVAGRHAMEPWARLVVLAPDSSVGRVVGDMARRRARLKGSESKGTIQILTAEAPLGDLIGFATDLRSLTAGRGQFTLTHLGYRADDATVGCNATVQDYD